MNKDRKYTAHTTRVPAENAELLTPHKKYPISDYNDLWGGDVTEELSGWITNDVGDRVLIILKDHTYPCYLLEGIPGQTWIVTELPE